MNEEVLLYSYCGELKYGTNIGHAYLKDGIISFPKETIAAIRENTLQEVSLVDDRIAISPTGSFDFGVEIEYEKLSKEFYQNMIEDESEEKERYENFKRLGLEEGYDEDEIEMIYKNNAPDRDVYYGGDFSEAMKNVPMFLLKGYLGYDENRSNDVIELTVVYEDAICPGQVVRSFYMINMNSDNWIYRNIPYPQFVQEQKARNRYFEMHLKDDPYEKILSGSKIYELRLYDDKRKKLKEGDVIRFDRLESDDKDKCFYTKVKELKKYASFSELYDASKSKEDYISMYRCGSPRNISKENFLKRMETYYPPEKQSEYGVVAIQLEVICSPETEKHISLAMEKAMKRRSVTNSMDFSTWDSFSGGYFKALCMVEIAHRGVKRKMSDIDFICHPVEVASITHDIVCSGDFSPIQIVNRVVAAAALHDVVEDTDYSLQDINEIFGESICELVAEETENKRREKRAEDTWRIRKEEFLDKLAKAPDFARAITLADKLSNMRDMLIDYKELGDNLWDKFNNKNMDDHAWYYKSVVKELGKPNKENDFIVDFVLSETKEYKELMELVDKIFE